MTSMELSDAIKIIRGDLKCPDDMPDHFFYCGVRIGNGQDNSDPRVKNISTYLLRNWK